MAVAPVEAKTVATGPAAADRFTREVTALAHKGWRLQRVALPSNPRYGRVVQLVMSSRHHARRLTLMFDRKDLIATRFTREVVPVPREFRHYHAEKSLLAVLAAGTPTEWDEACGGLSIGTSKNSVWLAPSDYFTADAPITGRAARRGLRWQLRKLLAAGYTLTGVHRSSRTPPGAAAALVVTLLGKHMITLHVGMDRRDRVISLQRLQAPSTAMFSKFKYKANLQTWLDSAAAVISLRLAAPSSKRGQNLVISSRKSTFVLKPTDFEHVPGCGC